MSPAEESVLAQINMKAFVTSVLTLLVFATGIEAVVVESADATVTSLTTGSDTDGTLEVSPCYWDGTAPFCAGSCPDGYIDCGRDYCGNGACCITGIKIYCCRENSGQC
ncbi:hypothetical protein C8Q73DRAFT_795844 [Cubamyces lactineus]|nr:hypothetical protein C8Q73DRAFT_795844 [Cubamyces lactineus]